MGIKYIGERISPQSKFSVQYGIAYEKNISISDPIKAKKVIAKYEYAVKNNWIVVVNISEGDGNVTKFKKSNLIERYSIYTMNNAIPHYVIKRSFLASEMDENEKNKHKPPFHIQSYRDYSLKFPKRKATVIKNLLLKEGIKNVFIAEYCVGLTGEHLGYEVVTSNSIENRFYLMDFD